MRRTMRLMAAEPLSPGLLFWPLTLCCPLPPLWWDKKPYAQCTCRGQAFRPAPDKNKANRLTCFLEGSSRCSLEATDFEWSHGAIFLKCTVEQVDWAFQRLGQNLEITVLLKHPQWSLWWGAYTSLSCCGFGGGKTYFLWAIASSHPFCVFFKLLPLLRPCFLSLLVSPQVAPPFHRPLWLFCDHPGSYSFCFSGGPLLWKEHWSCLWLCLESKAPAHLH